MNRPTTLPDIVTGHWYVMTESDLRDDGTDANGNPFPPQKLNRALCHTCDQVIPTCAVCACDVVHADLAPVWLNVGDPLLNRKEAA